MADAVTATTVEDGPKKAIFYCTNTSDGTGESAVTKVDVSALSSLKILAHFNIASGNKELSNTCLRYCDLQ